MQLSGAGTMVTAGNVARQQQRMMTAQRQQIQAPRVCSVLTNFSPFIKVTRMMKLYTTVFWFCMWRLVLYFKTDYAWRRLFWRIRSQAGLTMLYLLHKFHRAGSFRCQEVRRPLSRWSSRQHRVPCNVPWLRSAILPRRCRCTRRLWRNR